MLAASKEFILESQFDVVEPSSNDSDDNHEIQTFRGGTDSFFQDNYNFSEVQDKNTWIDEVCNYNSGKTAQDVDFETINFDTSDITEIV